MQTSVTELPDSRVRVEVEVPAEDVEKGVNRAARALAREMRLPGFRKGKAPPSLVIQRLGFGAGPRGGDPRLAARVVRSARCSTPGSARSATPSVEMVSTPQDEGEPLSFKFEIGVRPGGRARRVQGARGRPRRAPRSPEDIVDTRGRADPRGLRQARAGRAAGRRGRRAADRLRGLRRRQGLRGRHGRPTTCWSSARGRLIEGFEEQLTGADARRGAQGRGHLPRRLPGRAAGRQRRGLQRQGQGGAGEDPARPRRRLRLRRLRVRHAGGAARRHPRESSARRVGQRIEQDFRDRRGRRRGRQRRRVELPDELVTARADGALERMERQLAAQRDGPRRLPPDAGQNARGADRGIEARRRAAS